MIIWGWMHALSYLYNLSFPLPPPIFFIGNSSIHIIPYPSIALTFYSPHPSPRHDWNPSLQLSLPPFIFLPLRYLWSTTGLARLSVQRESAVRPQAICYKRRWGGRVRRTAVLWRENEAWREEGEASREMKMKKEKEKSKKRKWKNVKVWERCGTCRQEQT